MVKVLLSDQSTLALLQNTGRWTTGGKPPPINPLYAKIINALLVIERENF